MRKSLKARKKKEYSPLGVLWLLGALSLNGSIYYDCLKTIGAALEETAHKRLTFRERRVLEYRYGLTKYPPLTLKQTGEEIGVTRERIRQQEHNALRKLRRGWGHGTINELIQTMVISFLLVDQQGAIKKLKDLNYALAEEKSARILLETKKATDKKLQESYPKEVLELAIERLGLSVRTKNCLWRGGIQTLEQILVRGKHYLRSLRNFGIGAEKELVTKLFELGVVLSEEGVEIKEEELELEIESEVKIPSHLLCDVCNTVVVFGHKTEHLLSAHPEYKCVRDEYYNNTLICSLCNHRIAGPAVMVRHYKKYHPDMLEKKVPA